MSLKIRVLGAWVHLKDFDGKLSTRGEDHMTQDISSALYTRSHRHSPYTLFYRVCLYIRKAECKNLP